MPLPQVLVCFYDDLTLIHLGFLKLTGYPQLTQLVFTKNAGSALSSFGWMHKQRKRKI